MDREVRTVDDVLRLMDRLFALDADRWTADAASWWNGFYTDRAKDVPFLVPKPDENLVSYLDRGLVSPGRALDVGCGPGRNAILLASAGFQVDAVDLSREAIAWAAERSGDAGLDVRYDLIYDSGCFHHLPPHRRVSYLALIERVLAPGGHFALVCFAAGSMGSELSDIDLYRAERLDGGVAYTPESLRWIFGDLAAIELRRMCDEPPESPSFGESFLLTALFRRDDARTDDVVGL